MKGEESGRVGGEQGGKKQGKGLAWGQEAIRQGRNRPPSVSAECLGARVGAGYPRPRGRREPRPAALKPVASWATTGAGPGQRAGCGEGQTWAGREGRHWASRAGQATFEGLGSGGDDGGMLWFPLGLPRWAFIPLLYWSKVSISGDRYLASQSGTQVPRLH